MNRIFFLIKKFSKGYASKYFAKKKNCKKNYASIEIFHALLMIVCVLVLKFKVTFRYAYKLCITNLTC